MWTVSAGSAVGTPTFAQSPPTPKPNILFVLKDNLGYGELDVGGAGSLRGAPTPRIDKLPTEGCASPISTSEARTAISLKPHRIDQHRGARPAGADDSGNTDSTLPTANTNPPAHAPAQ
jgi:hypothetical protein